MIDDAPNPARPPVLVLVKDLLLSSRVTTAARAAGIPFKVIRDPATLATEAGDRVIADLNLPGAIEAAAAWSKENQKPVIGFVSHVDNEAITQARAAGIDMVLPRSRFVDQVERLLTD